MDDHPNRKATTAHSFGDSVDGYRLSKIHREGQDLETLANWCDDSARALDIATGAGHTAGALSEAGVPHVIASDASASMVATAIDSFPAVEGVVTDAERLPFADDAFDAVTCRIAAHHFPDPTSFVGEVARILRPGGTFAFEDNVAPKDDELDTFVNELEKRRDPTHVRSYKTSAWHEWLSDGGLTVEETNHLLKPLEYESWVHRIGSLDENDRAAVHRLLREAPEDAVEFFDIEYDEEGRITSFSSFKTLIRCVRR